MNIRLRMSQLAHRPEVLRFGMFAAMLILGAALGLRHVDGVVWGA